LKVSQIYACRNRVREVGKSVREVVGSSLSKSRSVVGMHVSEKPAKVEYPQRHSLGSHSFSSSTQPCKVSSNKIKERSCLPAHLIFPVKLPRSTDYLQYYSVRLKGSLFMTYFSASCKSALQSPVEEFIVCPASRLSPKFKIPGCRPWGVPVSK